MNPALQGLLTIIVGVGGCIGYFYFSNQFLDKVLYPAKGPNAGHNINMELQLIGVLKPPASVFFFERGIDAVRGSIGFQLVALQVLVTECRFHSAFLT